jgi:hypothetical protein
MRISIEFQYHDEVECKWDVNVEDESQSAAWALDLVIIES